MNKAIRNSDTANFWDSLEEIDRLDLLQRVNEITLGEKLKMASCKYVYLSTKNRKLVIQMYITTWRHFEQEKMRKFKKTKV